MNDCKFSGRPTKAPEIRYTDGAQPVAIARYTLAVDRRYKKDGGQQEPPVDNDGFMQIPDGIAEELPFN